MIKISSATQLFRPRSELDEKQKIETAREAIQQTRDLLENTKKEIGSKEEFKDLVAAINRASIIADKILDTSVEVSAEESRYFFELLDRIDALAESNTEIAQSLRESLSGSTEPNIVTQDISDTLDKFAEKIGQSVSTFVTTNITKVSTQEVADTLGTAVASSFLGPLATLVDFGSIYDLGKTGVKKVLSLSKRSDEFDSTTPVQSADRSILTDDASNQRSLESIDSNQDELLGRLDRLLEVAYQEYDLDLKEFKYNRKFTKTALTHLDDIADNLEDVGGFNIIGGLGKILGGLLRGGLVLGGLALSGIAGFKVGTAIWNNLPEEAQAAISDFVGKTVDAFLSIPEKITSAVSKVKEVASSVIDKISSAYQSVVDAISSAISYVKNLGSSIVEKISSAFDTVIDAITSAIDKIFNIGSTIKDAASSAVDATVESTKGFFKSAVDFLFSKSSKETTQQSKSATTDSSPATVVNKVATRASGSRSTDTADVQLNVTEQTTKSIKTDSIELSPTADLGTGFMGPVMPSLPGMISIPRSFTSSTVVNRPLASNVMSSKNVNSVFMESQSTPSASSTPKAPSAASNRQASAAKMSPLASAAPPRASSSPSIDEVMSHGGDLGILVVNMGAA